ncbi:unnamed protein product [Ilex paraguariensis]|uniref:Pentatricopeptide repeat-containing protein n=1 Tax=Ilex paraguariensis TaxID=185542 RepID=A0ABC8QVJ9_9AQUA
MQQIQPLSPFHRPVTLWPRFYHTIVNPLNIISFSSSPPPISSRRLRKFFPRKIRKEPSKPSLKRLTSRIVELTRRRQLLQIFEEVEKAKKLYGQLNTIVMNAVMQGCVHCGDIDSALRVFEEMSKLESCGVDNVTYGTLVKGLGDARRIDEAFQILESVERGTAAGNPKLSAPIIYGLLNSLIEAG